MTDDLSKLNSHLTYLKLSSYNTNTNQLHIYKFHIIVPHFKLYFKKFHTLLRGKKVKNVKF